MSPIQSPLPQSQMQQLQAKQRTLTTELRSIAVSQRANRHGLASALKAISNKCVEWDTIIEKKHASLITALNARTADLDNVGDFQKNQPLRLKTEGGAVRIVAFESRSFLKRLTGIGSGQRDTQAAALAARLGLTGKVATREDVEASVTKATEKLGAALPKSAQEYLHTLNQDIAEVAGKFKIKTEVTIDAAALKERRWKLTGAFESQGKEALKDALNSVHGTQKNKLKIDLGKVYAQIGQLNAQAAQERRTNAAAKSQALVKQNGIAVPKESLKTLTETLSKQRAESSFDTIYHTNVGCKSIQTMLETGHGSVGGGKVASEFEKAHGDTTFGGGEKKYKETLIRNANQLTPGALREINRTMHRVGLARYSGGVETQTTYRRAVHSKSMVDQLQSLTNTKVLIKPTRLMSTADDVAETKGYPAAAPKDGLVVNFKIQGFSSMMTGSTRNFSEGQERLYGTHSHFAVTSAQQGGNGEWHVTLVEQLVNLDHPGAVELTF